MTDLTALIARLEASAGPHREIDADIFRAIGLTEEQESHCKEWCRMDGRTDLTRDRYIKAWAPAFTRSVDDALTLVPDGAGLKIERYWLRRPEPAWRATIYTGGVPSDPARQFTAEDCYTAGAAITAAALKARAAMEAPR